ncbi:siroheme synthase middle domains-like protein [Coprinellus micaceus]|uniref:precorrin-2 dehydrogenase n=1 Tax=Coprinellus micaceus TaxID=71717 RepID=A0A4Y7SXR1_COPMI|nr:siroheme synthase middle domains-like protein [Coprinellus micaceus]
MSDQKTIGGGSLLIAWQLKGKRVLIVGGGEVGAQRIDSILATDAHIDLVSPSARLHTRTKQFLGAYPARITHLDQPFAFGDSSIDVGAYDMVLTALDDNDLSRRIVEACRVIRVPVNAADIPELCDFYFGGQVRDGPLQIMISTNGNGPRIAALIKDRVKGALSGKEGEALVRVGALRAKLKERAPGVGGELGKKRMRWMSRVCETWSLEELGSLGDEDVGMLLDEGWERNRVPAPAEILKGSKGSFWGKGVKSAGALSASVVSFMAGVVFARVAFSVYQSRR